MFIKKGETHECVNIKAGSLYELLDEAGLVGETQYTSLTYIRKADYQDVVVPSDAYDISLVPNAECVFLWVEDTDIYVWFECEELIMHEDMSYYFSVNQLGNSYTILSYLAEINGIEYLNTSKATDMSYMFYANKGLTELDLRTFDTSNVTTMSRMFSSASKLCFLDLTEFDTLNVTDMSSMFSWTYIETLDLSSFDTRNVTTMRLMFECSNGLVELDLTSFDTSNVTTMMGMFACSINLETLELSSFEISSETITSAMLGGCPAIALIYARTVEEHDIYLNNCTLMTTPTIIY